MYRKFCTKAAACAMSLMMAGGVSVITSENNVKNYEKVKQKNEKLERDNKKLENKINSLKKYINKTFECVSILFDFPIERLKNIIKDFYEKTK